MCQHHKQALPFQAVNSIVLYCRSAWQSASSDPTLPLGAAICFCTYRLFDKRRKRNPEGPYWGNSPVWGALGATVLGLVVGGLVSMLC